ncbi:MAG: glycosyltransferase [Actinomycetota bacterium]|nr:glycosyltransferase [Actinomycetota bacterium]
MRILQVHNRYRLPGGEDVVVAAERELLERAGHEVVVHQETNPSGTVESAWKLARAPWNRDAAEIVRNLARWVRPDVAHVHNTWFALSPAVIPALRAANVPVVMTLHNYRLICANAQLFRDGRPCEDCVGTHPWHGVRHACYRGSPSASASAAATIAVHNRRGTWDGDVEIFLALTQFARDRFIAGGLPPDRVRVKPNFVGDPGPRLQPPSASDYLLYVGRLSPEKGLLVALEAARRLGQRQWRLLVVGDGPLRQQAEALAVPGVEFTGWLPREDVCSLMHGARGLIFPSVWYEGFALTIVEAMAAGLPVIASRLGGTPDVLGPDAGWLAPPGDAHSWRDALAQTDEDVRVDAAGHAGRRRWRERYSPQVALPQLEQLYETARRSYVGAAT